MLVPSFFSPGFVRKGTDLSLSITTQDHYRQNSYRQAVVQILSMNSLTLKKHCIGCYKRAIWLRAVSTGVLNHPTPTALALWHSVCFPFGQSLRRPPPRPPPLRFHLIQHWLCLPLHHLCPLPHSPLLSGEAFHVSRHIQRNEREMVGEKCLLASHWL